MNNAFPIVRPKGLKAELAEGLTTMICDSWRISLLAIMACMLSFPNAKADSIAVDTLSVTVSFKQNRTELLPGYMNNGIELSKLAEAMQQPQWKNSRISIVGYASPEGPHLNNERLSRRRANVISNYLQEVYSIPADLITVDPIGVDWPGLVEMLSADNEVPMADKVLEIIRTTSDYDANGKWLGERTRQLKQLDGGAVWNYMLQNVYPYLRGANAMLVHSQPVNAREYVEMPAAGMGWAIPQEEITDIDIIPAPIAVTLPDREDALNWSLHTNLLYDAFLVPNIGAEVYLGKHMSLGANYWNAWWDSKPKNRFWRTYGLYVAGRYWFGKAAQAKPLTGHHVGIYVQAMLYDFELGGTGYLSGEAGKNIFHHPTLAAGVEYGYALPIARRLNLDFAIGIGYLQGQYQVYDPQDGGYIWRSTRNRRWFGPTKAEVSLVWLIGADNYNKKGGAK